MPIVIAPDSALGIEMRRWDTPRDRNVRTQADEDTGVPGMKNLGYEPFPKMLYKAITKDGRAVVNDPMDQGVGANCQKIVRDESELQMAKGQGWVESPLAALDA